MSIPSPLRTPDGSPDPEHVTALLGGLLDLATRHDDPARVFSAVAAGAADLPGVGAAGVLVRSPAGPLMPVGTSTERGALLELLAATATNPTVGDTLHTGTPTPVGELAGASTDGTGDVGEAARALGVAFAYGIPLATGRTAMGTLHLFAPGSISASSLSVSRSLADVATLALLGADPDHDGAVVARRLHLAIEARVSVEQAKGVLAARFATTPDEAFERLMTAAGATGRPLGAVAAAVVDRTTDAALDAALAAPQGGAGGNRTPVR